MTAQATARPDAFRGLLRNREYRLYFLSSLASSLGAWAGLFALQTRVNTLSSGRLALFALGGVMMARLLPSLFAGPVAGVLADRYDRKRLMVGCDIARGLLYVGLALSDDLIGLLALTLIVESLSMLYVAAKDAILPGVVDRGSLTEANQLNIFVTYGTLPLGAVAGSVVTGVSALAGVDPDVGIRAALLFNAVAFLAAGLVSTQLRLPPSVRRARSDGEETPGFTAELRAGLAFINDRPVIRSLILGVVGIFFGAGVVVGLGPSFVPFELGRPDSDWFTLVAAVGIGLIGGIAGVSLLKGLPRERVFPAASAAVGALGAAIALLPSFPAVLACGALLGVAVGISFVVGYTLLHERTPADVRARTFATLYTGTRVALFASLGLSPFLAGVIGTFSLSVGGAQLTLSGTRLAMLAGSLFALGSAVSAGAGMSRAARGPSTGGFHVPGFPAADRMPDGVLVAFEGVEGAGKSTQVRALADALRAEGRDVLVTREPGGTPVAERIREVLLVPGDAMHPRTEALLYAAARAEHLERLVVPALDAGQVVLCDRFLDSSLAYQGFGRDLGLDEVAEINRWATGGVLPDVVVLLDLDPREGLARVARRAGDPNRLDREDLAFHQRVAEGYAELARRQADRFVVVPADGDPAEVTRRVLAALRPRLTRPAGPPPGAGGARAAAAATARGAPGANGDRPTRPLQEAADAAGGAGGPRAVPGGPAPLPPPAAAVADTDTTVLPAAPDAEPRRRRRRAPVEPDADTTVLPAANGRGDQGATVQLPSADRRRWHGRDPGGSPP